MADFSALTPAATTPHEMQEVETGTGALTTTHTSNIYALDEDGFYRELLADEPVWHNARIELDPAQLFGEFATTATTPDPFTILVWYNDGSKSSYKIGDYFKRNVNNGANLSESDVPSGTDVDMYLGSLSGATTIRLTSTQLSGSIPDLSALTSLSELRCNICQLTGSIPSLTSNTALSIFYCNNNLLTGSLPSLASNTALVIFAFYSNSLSGSLPDLSALTSLSKVLGSSNSLTGYAGGWPAKAFTLDLWNNDLTETAVNLVLTEADTYGVASGTTIDISGGTSASPTGAGITAKANLIANGATVTTN